MFRLFRRKKNKKTKVEPVKTETTVQPKQEEKVVEPVKEEAPTAELNTPVKEESKKPRKMSYHITKHAQGGWQIKKAGAQRALKRFKTQKEAIDYAKELEKNGASYVIHKADGKTRKKTY